MLEQPTTGANWMAAQSNANPTSPSRRTVATGRQRAGVMSTASKATGLGATLAIDLPAGDWQAVLHAHHQLNAKKKHPLIVCPGPHSTADNWLRLPERAWLLIAPLAAAQRVTNEQQPVQVFCKPLQGDGIDRRRSHQQAPLAA